MMSFRHAWASFREVVQPLFSGALPYLVALTVVVGLAAFIWYGLDEGGSESVVDSDFAAVEVTYAEALVLIEAGEVARGREAMRALAPLNRERLGNIEAHAWLARDLLGLDVEATNKQVSRDELLEAEGHLSRVVNARGGGQEIVELLVGVHLKLQDPAKALGVLGAEAGRFPELHLLGARVAASLGDRIAKGEHAVSASAYFEKVCEETTAGPGGNLRGIIALAEAEGWLGNFEKMRGLLAKVPEGHEGKKALVLRSWLGSLRSELGQLERKDEALAQLKMAFSELGLEASLIEIATLFASRAPEDDEILKLYEELAVMETVDVASLVSLGSLALVLGKREAGLAHLERVVALAPEHVVALNNLAYGLAERGDAEDLARALEFVDRAVAAGRKLGTVPANCWETRGQILAKLERWRDAAVDLERALVRMSGSRDIHETLGRVYSELGQEALAAEHGRLAEAAK